MLAGLDELTNRDANTDDYFGVRLTKRVVGI